MLEFSTFMEPIARKPHKCNLCNGAINPGTKYIRFSGKYCGDMFDIKLHSFCNDIVERYCGYIGDNEYDNDAVIDWVTEVACSGCKYFEEDNDYPPCHKSIFECERVRNYFQKGGDKK